MTETQVKYGCLSQSLEKFLSMKNDQKRRKKYGNKTTAKYYERIVKSVNGSFEDHLHVITKLPDEHKKKIDFATQYNRIATEAVTKNFIEQTPDRFLEETIQHLLLIHKDIPEGPLQKHILQDIDKVSDWLWDIKLQRENKK